MIGRTQADEAELHNIRDTLKRAFYPKLHIAKVVPVWKEQVGVVAGRCAAPRRAAPHDDDDFFNSCAARQGCFVHFESTDDAMRSLEYSKIVSEHMERSCKVGTLSLAERIRAARQRNRASTQIYLVQGLPFVEDLRDWRPTSELHIETGAAKVSIVSAAARADASPAPTSRRATGVALLRIASIRPLALVALRRRKAVCRQVCRHARGNRGAQVGDDDVASRRFCC